MLLVASVAVSIISLLFGIYQWRKQRGDVRIELQEIQATIYIKICANSPAQITVNGIAYQVRARRLGLSRFFSELRRNENETRVPLSRRVKFAWFIHNFIGMAWCHPVTNGHDDSPFSPISGPAIPTKIDGYHDASWAFDTTRYAGLFRSLNKFAEMNPRMRFIARIAGHPRREVRSRWLQLKNMEAFAPSNAWLFEHAKGWSNSEESETDGLTNSDSAVEQLVGPEQRARESNDQGKTEG
jgi:hypothetical protein